MDPELPRIYLETQEALPTGFELRGISDEGPDRGQSRWIAVAIHHAHGFPSGIEHCEGWGATPAEAALDLVTHTQTEHATGD